MEQQEILEEYSDSVRRIRQQFIDSGMSEAEFHETYLESLDSITNNKTNSQRRPKNSRVLVIGLIMGLCVAYNYKNIYSWTACHLQDFVYPGLKFLRRLSIPIISLFPSLTALYHESCLIQNPFFSVVDMDCWPCSTANVVWEIHNPKPVTQQHSAPFIYETDQQTVSLDLIYDLYIQNKEMFDTESQIIIENNKRHVNPTEMFDRAKEKESGYYIWKFNNMNLARLLRQIIPRPKVVPKFGQSTERYLIIDSSQRSFKIPDTECNFSFLLSLSGSRVIKLIPAEECKLQCKSLQVELKENYLLWYNWWYWRPEVQPTTNNTTMIAHLGSYC